MTAYKIPKLFGKDEDGKYEGKIEQIDLGILKKEDTLCISNRKPDLWIFSLFSGYKQIGTFKITKGHDFKEGQDVIVIKENDKIIKIMHA